MGKKVFFQIVFFGSKFLIKVTIVNVRISVPPFAFLIALSQEPPYQRQSPVKPQVLSAATGSVAVTELQVLFRHLFNYIFFCFAMKKLKSLSKDQ